MIEINEIVKDYLKTPKTDYALMIKGDWGSGKTYFIKNSLNDYIGTIDSLTTDKKGSILKFKPVYISLFGVTNSIDVLERIQLEINPWLKSKPLEYSKMILSKVGSLIGLSVSKNDLKEFVSTFNVASNIVLFFDDLERKSKKADTINIIGQINQLTEHQNLKVIIVCNSEKTDELFSKTNEKTIRFSSLYIPEITSIYDEIIANYADNYRLFLSSRKDLILDVFDKIEYKNLRTLRFILDTFQKVFQITSPARYKEEILDRFLLFHTIYSIENKEGNPPIFLNKLKELGPWEINFDIEPLLPPGLPANEQDQKQEQSEEVKYYEDVRGKYKLFIELFQYSATLARYVDTGFLNQEKFEQEINSIIDEFVKKEESEETKTIKAIKDWKNIDDEELAPLKQHVLEKVESGELSLYGYIPIFAEFLLMEHYQVENTEVTPEIIQLFKTGIDRSKENHGYEAAFHFKLTVWNEQSPLKDKFNEIRDYLIDANTQSLERKATPIKQQLIESIRSNDSEGLLEILQNLEFLNEPILEIPEPGDLFGLLKIAEFPTIYALNHGIRFRYSDSNYKSLPVFNHEKEFLTALLGFTEHYIGEQEVRKVSIVPFIDLQTILQGLLRE